ncbi:hypothetical protein CEN44_26520 [Fischerella muscicola CCMEE 5323]|uniref:Uncharacterized protein n=1 Tax=Fischerella muscicola CCMEE 5323 TaxID=2019572 RepID=A0A2N6JVM3_FISMU|nr:hypothetical protein CEN44_26520 [Fischerella muscicola CCMEE 5323]
MDYEFAVKLIPVTPNPHSLRSWGLVSSPIPIFKTARPFPDTDEAKCAEILLFQITIILIYYKKTINHLNYLHRCNAILAIPGKKLNFAYRYHQRKILLITYKQNEWKYVI